MTHLSRIATSILLSAAALLVQSDSLRAALTAVRIAENLESPVFLTAPAGDARLFILEQRGVIRIYKDGSILSRPFLDIESLVRTLTGTFNEFGLLGLAFHPNYQSNGRFYVYYINNASDSVLEEYYVSSDPDSAIADSSRTILEVFQPGSSHNGGTIAFHPTDGYLYFGLGDGGSGFGDPLNRAQNPDSLLGKMLRIDVDVDSTYAIPPDNPYVGDPGGRDEIWSLGFRNPYRWSFDRLTGDQYIGDVGQTDWEEVSFEPDSAVGGRNYGWHLIEGTHCFIPPTDCNPDSILILPIYEYFNDVAMCAVTGGYVYRGLDIAGLQGTYFFGDFCSRQIWSFREVGGDTTEFRERTAELIPPEGVIEWISAFGEDGFGELYIVDRGQGLGSSGEIYKIVEAGPVSVDPLPLPIGGLRLQDAVPNPFVGTTRVRAIVREAGALVVSIHDVRGRIVTTIFRGPAKPGTMQLEWDGNDGNGLRVPVGVYYLHARLGVYQETRTVVLTD